MQVKETIYEQVGHQKRDILYTYKLESIDPLKRFPEGSMAIEGDLHAEFPKLLRFAHGHGAIDIAPDVWKRICEIINALPYEFLGVEFNQAQHEVSVPILYNLLKDLDPNLTLTEEQLLGELSRENLARIDEAFNRMNKEIYNKYKGQFKLQDVWSDKFKNARIVKLQEYFPVFTKITENKMLSLHKELFSLLRQITFNTGLNKSFFFGGDTLSDRGHCDAYNLWFFDQMTKNGINYKIIFSNHDTGYFEKEYTKGFWEAHIDNSKINHDTPIMQRILKEQGLDNDALIQNFKDHVVPFEVSLDGNGGLAFISHSPVGIIGLYYIAQKYHNINPELSFQDFCKDQKLFIATVNRVNKLFKKQEKAGKIDQIFCDLVWWRHNMSLTEYYTSKEQPEKSFADIKKQEANYCELEEKLIFVPTAVNSDTIISPIPSIHNLDLGITIIHGHDRYALGQENKQFVCLDSEFGKRKSSGQYNIQGKCEYPVVVGNIDIRIEIAKMLDGQDVKINPKTLLALDLKLKNKTLSSPAFSDRPLELTETQLQFAMSCSKIDKQQWILEEKKVARRYKIASVTTGAGGIALLGIHFMGVVLLTAPLLPIASSLFIIAALVCSIMFKTQSNFVTKLQDDIQKSQIQIV
jgi:hypothetical protein